jgi:hypothetical protein
MQIARHFETPSILTRDDLSNYDVLFWHGSWDETARDRLPLSRSYRYINILTAPPPEWVDPLINALRLFPIMARDGVPIQSWAGRPLFDWPNMLFSQMYQVASELNAVNSALPWFCDLAFDIFEPWMAPVTLSEQEALAWTANMRTFISLISPLQDAMLNLRHGHTGYENPRYWEMVTQTTNFSLAKEGDVLSTLDTWPLAVNYLLRIAPGRRVAFTSQGGAGQVGEALYQRALAYRNSVDTGS